MMKSQSSGPMDLEKGKSGYDTNPAQERRRSGSAAAGPVTRWTRRSRRAGASRTAARPQASLPLG